MRKTTKHTRSAAIYTRISEDRNAVCLGVERQEEECRALAKRLGWTVTEVYSDPNISAFKGRRRPDYERMLTDIKGRRINAVIAWDPDRLHRRSRELERYIDICEKHDVANQTVCAGMWDLTTPAGRMVARQLGAVAAYESEHKSARLKSARVQHAKQGKHHGGIRCYGYTGGKGGGTTVIPEEAAEIAAACQQVAEGVSLRAIVRDMNARKVPTASGNIAGCPVLDKKTGQPLVDKSGRTRLHLGWTSQQLRQTLMSPRIAGWSVHGKVKDEKGKDTKKALVVGTAAWPAIIGDALWRNVEEILSSDTRRTNHGVTGAVKWLGSGLYVCACGQRSMRVSVTGGSRRYTYRCANSGDRSKTHTTRDAVALDAHVERLLVKRLSKPGTVEKLAFCDNTTDVAALRAEQARLGNRKDEAASMFAKGVIDAVQLETITKNANQRATEIAETLAQAGWRSPLEPLVGGDIEAAWQRLSLAQKRAVLDVVADVHVLPTKPTTRGFDIDGVGINWKKVK
jgi:DNA invertase Pin-like site-specific DNA recombinase